MFANLDIKGFYKEMELEQIAVIQRVLILDIHRLKEKSGLIGNTSEEQYANYKTRCLENGKYMLSLCEEFPEMHRLIELEVKNNILMIKEITSHLQNDQSQLIQTFCSNQNFTEAIDIKFTGDSHNGGERAARVQLDNGVTLYYKPHSLRKAELYQNVYAYLCRRTGIDCKKVNYLTHADYGWEENVENKSCNTRGEIERYYFRMGIHLFLGYALSATDLHGENIVAHGEHPVVIDFETFPGYHIQIEESSVKRKIETMLAGSVIHTGMLPVLTWGQGKNTVIISAMSNGEKITTPFKMPVVKNEKTSDVYIDYEPIEFEIKECVVRLNEKPVNPGEYTDFLVQGFQAAFCEALKDKNVEKMLEPFFQGKSRVVLRQTQQYLMYQTASFHPDYMKERADRKELLSVIHKKGETPLQKALRDYEIESLLEVDIPYFEIDGNKTGIYDGDGRYYEGYLPHTPYEMWKEHMRQMDDVDMKRQCDFIRLSMAMLNSENQSAVSETADGLLPQMPIKERIKNQIYSIVSGICTGAVTAGDDISWIKPQFFDKERWKLASMGMYLYDGISGIAVFLAGYLHHFRDEKAEKIFLLTVRKMMRYTDELNVQNGMATDGKTGLFDGEASIVYSYILLYQITGEEHYLCYARKHFKMAQPLLAKDVYLDLLSGNAGAIEAALMLYRYTKEKEYLNIAVQTEQSLWEKRTETEVGVGWKLESTDKPLAGMAHGNSGFLMAYSSLYEATKEPAYLRKISKILAYEDFLYMEEQGNWIDLRRPEQEKHTMNAWCHGAPGILLARLRLETIANSEAVSLDIDRASNALFEEDDCHNLCLCHGLAGNLLIMREFLKKHKNEKYQKKYTRVLETLLYKLENKSKEKASEVLNPAFMNGITGIGYALLKLYEDSNPLR